MTDEVARILARLEALEAAMKLLIPRVDAVELGYRLVERVPLDVRREVPPP